MQLVPTTPPTLKLRDYQDAAVASIFKYFEEGGRGNPLVALPTGTGKSLVIGKFVQSVYQTYPGQRIIKLTHVKELIAQNYEKLLALWPTAPAGIFSAGLGRKEACYPITFAGIASAVKNPGLFGRVDLVLIDEAHLVSPKEGSMYQRFILALRAANPFIKVIGFTATHYRLGQGLLTDETPGGEPGLFTDICFDMTQMEAFNWLIDEGYLTTLIPRRTSTELNVEGVSTHAGEFIQKELQAAVDKEAVTYQVLQEARELAADRGHWLVFASGIEHALHVRDMLESLGIPATCVHSKMGDAERDTNILAFKAGKYRAMVNNGILTTGFDYPAIDCIVMLRPTQSPSLWVQMLGRGTRPVFPPGMPPETKDGRLAAIAASPKPNCLVLDFAGNTRRLGPINDPVIPKPKGKGGGGVAPVKLCEHCGTYNHTRARFCINCKAEFPVKPNIYAGASTEALIAESLPQVTKFKVDRVTYAEHRPKDGRPPSLRVSYYCGLRRFEEWVCLEHLGYAKRKAQTWWTSRAQLAPPATVLEALGRIKELRTPVEIGVWVNKKHPEVMNYGY